MGTTAHAQLRWRTSSYSGDSGNCVEVAPNDSAVLLRHSKHRDAGTITFAHEAWADFVRAAQEGLQSATGGVVITRVGTDTLVTSLAAKVEMRFDDGEWSAFLAGAADGEFSFVQERLAVAR